MAGMKAIGVRMANKDYIKIFAPEDAKLISLSGNGNFRSADSAYSKDYMKDIDLESIEKIPNFRINSGL